MGLRMVQEIATRASGITVGRETSHPDIWARIGINFENVADEVTKDIRKRTRRPITRKATSRRSDGVNLGGLSF